MFQQLGPIISLVAAADLSGLQNRFVKINSAGKAAAVSAGGPTCGVLITNDGTAGQAVGVQTEGIASVELGGTVDEGEYVKVDANGKAVAVSGSDLANGIHVGQCVLGGDSGAIGAILLKTLGSGRVATSEIESIADDADHAVATSNSTRRTLVTLGTTNFIGVLADGLYVGQEKIIEVIAASGGFTYALTPTTMQAGQPASFTFTAKGQQVVLRWASDGWVVIDGKTAGAGTTADAATINTLIARQGLTIAGTENRVLPSGMWIGQQIFVYLDTDTSGSTTLTGVFYDEDGSADATTVTMNDALDMVHLVWLGSRWLVNTQVSAPAAP